MQTTKSNTINLKSKTHKIKEKISKNTIACITISIALFSAIIAYQQYVISKTNRELAKLSTAAVAIELMNNKLMKENIHLSKYYNSIIEPSLPELANLLSELSDYESIATEHLLAYAQQFSDVLNDEFKTSKDLNSLAVRCTIQYFNESYYPTCQSVDFSHYLDHNSEFPNSSRDISFLLPINIVNQ